MDTMNIRDRHDVVPFKEAAERFCALFESVPSDINVWVEQMVSALAHLYAFGHDLPDLDLLMMPRMSLTLWM